MSGNFDYTSYAQRFVARFPLITYIGTQVNFWVIANMLLGTILHLQALRLNQDSRLAPMLGIAALSGIFYGIILGMTDYYLDKNVFKKKSLGKVILLKVVISLSILVILLFIIKSTVIKILNLTLNGQESYNINNTAWEYLFYMLLIYYFFMTLVVSFVIQVNKKFGPGVLVPLLFGKYRNPREEERIFMFMDLKSSTTFAENLGHLQYSSFIQDCFMDINQLLLSFNARVYQYVGDEIVLTWGVKDGLKNFSCIRFFFACEKQFHYREQHYISKYGILPQFKAGLHSGKVTAVEIGEIKRDIAYHGDTLNTAARIQGVCNEYDKNFLVSEDLLDVLGKHSNLKTKSLGMIRLRGKTKSIGIASAEWNDLNI